MFVAQKIVYLELQKTGCTHIRNLLKEVVGGEFVDKHNLVDSNFFNEDKIFLGSVRNPWEWYTSLWAYGCDRRGGIYTQVTKPGISLKGIRLKNNPYAAFTAILAGLSKDPQKWQQTYRDVNDAGAFREWLHMMHDKRYWYDFCEGYGVRPVSKVAGLLTYRYLKLFCTKNDELNKLDTLSTFHQLADYEKENCFITHFIRNEQLESDLFTALEKCAIAIPDQKKTEIMSCSRTNASSRSYGANYYYDSASEKLIAAREQLIIEKFGYVAPSLSNNTSSTVLPVGVPAFYSNGPS
ncbi:MAG: hypothetical protein AAGC93_19200 [Cyanobacteria bacterium P01_F01_bin.53]